MPNFGRTLTLPAPLAEQGYVLRGETDADRPFLERLYLIVRWDELAPSGWSDDQKRRFLSWQFALQHRHYTEHYHDADFGIVEQSGLPAGRLYLFRGADDTRIVDISLLPEQRGRGVGTALLTAVFAESVPAGRSVSIHVELFNPARRLYERLGFRELSRNGVYALMEWPGTKATATAGPPTADDITAVTGARANARAGDRSDRLA